MKRKVTPTELALFSRSPVIGAWWEQLNKVDSKRAPKPKADLLDELLFESPNNEVEIVKDKVSEIMIRSHEKYLALSVPIKVDVGVGESWDDAH